MFSLGHVSENGQMNSKTLYFQPFLNPKASSAHETSVSDSGLCDYTTTNLNIDN